MSALSALELSPQSTDPFYMTSIEQTLWNAKAIIISSKEITKSARFARVQHLEPPKEHEKWQFEKWVCNQHMQNHSILRLSRLS